MVKKHTKRGRSGKERCQWEIESNERIERKGWKTRGHIELGQEDESDAMWEIQHWWWKGKKGQSESRCSVKTVERKRQRLINGWRGMPERLSFFLLFPPMSSQGSPPGRCLLLHPDRPTCFPSLYPPAVVLLSSSSSVLYATQLHIHFLCIRTHLPRVCAERASNLQRACLRAH